MDQKPSKFAKVVNSLFTWVFVLYFLMVLLPNIVHPEFLNNFLSTPLMSKLVQYKGVPFILYFILVLIANKKMPKWQAIVSFLLLGIYTLVVMYFAPRDLTYEYINSKGVITPHEVTVTLADQFKFYGPYLFGIMYAFCLFYIAPITGEHGKTKSVVIWVLILIALLSCAYSYVAELDKYKTLFAGLAKNKWVLDIRSVYANKNRFGSVIFAGFVASLILCVSSPKGLRPLGYILGIYFTASCLIIRCDDAFLSCVFGWMLLFLGMIIANFKKHWITCLIFSLLYAAIVAGALFCVFAPSIYTSVSLLKKAHDFLMQINGATGRFLIWKYYFGNLSGYQYLFGIGHIGYFIDNIVERDLLEELSLHNGVIDYFNAGGVVYVVFLAFLSVKSAIIINKQFKTNPLIFAALLAIYGSFFLYGFAETFTPFTARFINTAAISYLITAWPMALPKPKESSAI